MDPKLIHEFNVQIKEELYSAYLYLAMSAKSRQLGFDGIANWFFIQFQEELDHAKGLFKYMQTREADADLLAIPEPDKNLGTEIADLFKLTLEHEKFITGRINLLYKMAMEVGDFASVEFLRWYVSEQVEEEANANKYLDKATRIKAMPDALYILDDELALRIYTPIDPANLGAAA